MNTYDRPSRRPQRRLLGLSLVALAISTFVMFATLRVPIANLNVQRFNSDHLILGGASTTVVPYNAIFTLLSRNEDSLKFEANVLVDGIAARGKSVQREAWWQTRENIVRRLQAGPVTVELPGGERIDIQSRARRLTDLTERFWAALLTGHVALLFGIWILVMRPRNSAARAFAATSLGLFGIGCTLAAAYDPLLLGQLYRWMMLVNHASIQVFAAGILVLFCRFPKPIFGWRVASAIGLTAIVLTLVDLADLATDPIVIVYTSIGGAFIALVLLVTAQFFATRADPSARSAMRLMGASAVISGGLIVGMVILPYLIRGAPLVSEAVALPLLLAIYAGLGIAVARTRLFAMEHWGLSLFLSTCVAIAVAALDLSLLSLVSGLQGVLLPIAIGSMALLYFPLRQRLSGRRSYQGQHSLHLASELAFTISFADRDDRWRAALVAMFDPLESTVADPVEKPTVIEGGNALHLPGVGDIPPMLLRYAARGERDFDLSDAEQAAEIVGVVTTLMGARDAYIRGVEKERQRIARDLHDDVAARLLTSLHRDNQTAMREDVREAIADIRAIVSGASGDPRVLDDVLADLRFEMASRLDAAGVRLDWPVAAETGFTISHDAAKDFGSIVRELTSNVIRHAKATIVTVTLEIADHFLLVLSDDGVGSRTEKPGNGLRNCSERAQRIGADFSFSSGNTGSQSELRVKAPVVFAPFSSPTQADRFGRMGSPARTAAFGTIENHVE